MKLQKYREDMIYLSVLRPQHWYKNLLVFLPVIFSLNLLDTGLFFLSLQGFILFCLASSGLYIINDLLDFKSDKIHPIKKQRPIASGKISKKRAFVLALIFLAVSVIGSIALHEIFFLCIILFISSTITYSVVGKNFAFLDAFLISINYVLRAIAGGYLLELQISNWLIVGIFFFALLLCFTKRKNEVVLLKTDSVSHRKSLETYSKRVLHWSILVSSSALLAIYSVYAFLGSFTTNDSRLVFTIPIAIIIIITYLRKIQSDEHSSKEFHQILVGSRLLLSEVIVFIISILVLMYLIPSKFFV